MNECSGCRENFGSVEAFDAHRVGVHAYTFEEGLSLEPARFDGRRCLSVDEMTSGVSEEGVDLRVGRFVSNKRGSWTLERSLDRVRARFRGSGASVDTSVRSGDRSGAAQILGLVSQDI